MSMFNFIKKLFNKEESESIIEYNLEEETLEPDDKPLICADCNLQKIGNCNPCIMDNIAFVNSYHANRKTLIIVDDNRGSASFLADDLYREIGEDINIITFTSEYAGFILEEMLDKTGIGVDYAILDITLGGIRRLGGKNVVYDGVDIYKILMEKNSETEYLFYTSNNMNKQLKTINALIVKYNKTNRGNDIENKIIYKASKFSKQDIESIISKLNIKRSR